MDSNRVYELDQDPSALFVMLMTLVCVGAGTFFIWLQVFGRLPGATNPPWYLAIWMFGTAGVVIWMYLTVPYSISLSPDGLIEVTSRRRRKVVYATEVRSIKAGGLFFRSLVLRATSGTIRFPAQFDGLHNFLTRLEAKNPKIEFRGC